MASSTEIADAAQQLVKNGYVTPIDRLASIATNQLAIVRSVGVVPKLVDVVCAWSGNDPYYALRALTNLVKSGVEAQNAAGDAHSGKIFRWLAGPVDNGRPDEKWALRSALTSGHTLNQARLAAVGNNVKQLLEWIKSNVATCSSATLASVVDLCSAATQTGDAAAFQQLGGIDAMNAVVDWRPSVCDSDTLKAQDQAIAMLAKYGGLQETSESRSALLETLREATSDDDTSGSVRKHHALRRLFTTIQSCEGEALAVAHEHGVVDALMAIVRSEYLSGADGRALTEWLWEYAVRVLTTLAEVDSTTTTARQQIARQNAIMPLLVLSRSTNPLCKSAAMDALYVFLRDKALAITIAQTCGIPFLVTLLHRRGIPTLEQQSPIIVEILSTLLLTSNANLRVFTNCSGAVALLVTLCKSATPAIRESAQTLVQSLRGLAPLLLDPLLTAPSADQLIKLSALETMSRVPANQSVIAEAGGIKCLAKLLEQTKDDQVKTTTIRILANLANGNDANRVVIAASGAMTAFVSLLSSTTNPNLVTAAATALRNLASNDANRRLIGSLGVIPRTIEIARDGKTLKQREVAAAVLGNLARLPANKKKIIAHGGIAALVVSIDEEFTIRQLETVAMALWVLVADSLRPIAVVKTHGVLDVRDIQELAAKQQPAEMPWATRLLTAIKATGGGEED